MVKNLPANAGNPGSISEWGKSTGGNGNPLQYSCLENPTDRGAWQATVHTVHGVAKSRTQLSTDTHATYTQLEDITLSEQVVPSRLVSRT